MDEVVSSRQKSAKKRSLYVINEHFKPIFNAEMATQAVSQRFSKQFNTDNLHAHCCNEIDLQEDKRSALNDLLTG